MNYVIVVAGGKGLRMGAELPKQFLPIGGRPLLMYTLEAFAQAVPGIKIVLVLPRDQQAYWQDLCRKHAFTLAHIVADGGATRFHSVRSGLQAVSAMSCVDSEGEDFVAVHDGVRPFVAHDVICRCFDVARECGTAVPVVPVVETVRELLSDGSATRDRSRFRLVQTPQTFSLSLLRQAYEQPYTEAFTDDASVVEALGVPITLVDGNRENIKITTPFDLTLAEVLLGSS